MSFFAIFFLVLQTSEESFTRFTYCRDLPRGAYEKQCIHLTPDGVGQSQFQRRGSSEVELALTLSAPGRDRFLSVIAATKNLENRENYETKRKVADLGQKRVVLEMPSGSREAKYNYSDFKEVNALSSFFDGLLNQQDLVFSLENAARYERLSVPERLDRLEGELKAGRIGDPQGLIPALDKIMQDSRVMDYAREHAQQMKSRITQQVPPK